MVSTSAYLLLTGRNDAHQLVKLSAWPSTRRSAAFGETCWMVWFYIKPNITAQRWTKYFNIEPINYTTIWAATQLENGRRRSMRSAWSNTWVPCEPSGSFRHIQKWWMDGWMAELHDCCLPNIYIYRPNLFIYINSVIKQRRAKTELEYNSLLFLFHRFHRSLCPLGWVVCVRACIDRE